MNKRTVPCRVCGKEFVPCGKSSAEIGAFNYREVACSEKCGAEYLRRVLTGRSPAPADAEKPLDVNLPEIVGHAKKCDIEKHMVSDDTEN